MDRFSFVIAEDMEEERIDKCLSIALFYPETDPGKRRFCKRNPGKSKL